MAKKDEQNKEETPGSGDIKTSDASPESLGLNQVQDKMDDEQEKGYRGTKVDETPNHAYTVEGVINNEPTPETDPALARQAGSAKFDHLNETEGKK